MSMRLQIPVVAALIWAVHRDLVYEKCSDKLGFSDVVTDVEEIVNSRSGPLQAFRVLEATCEVLGFVEGACTVATTIYTRTGRRTQGES
jgi:hypothetical protein